MAIKDRKKKEKLQRIQQIQAGARSVFFKKGYQAATMEEIANRAELSKGTVYFYFKSKDELYVSLMIPMIEELSRLLTKFEKRVVANFYYDSHSFLNGLFEIFVTLQAGDPEGLRIFQNFQLNSLFSVMSKETQIRLKKLGKNNFAILRGSISKANKLGLVSKADPVLLADIIWGLFLGLNQLEDSKSQLSGEYHLTGTLNYSVKVLSEGLSVD